jgi:hypothetical protein
MRLPPKNPGFPHSAILHAIVSTPADLLGVYRFSNLLWVVCLGVSLGL